MRYFGECAVAVVDITEVLFFVVVCNIDVRPAVVVQIADCSAQSEIQSAPMDSGLLTHFDKLTIVVAIQLVAEIGMPQVPQRSEERRVGKECRSRRSADYERYTYAGDLRPHTS